MKQLRFYGGLSIIQWFFFLLATSVALPIVIGGVFHLSMEEISELMQRTFFVVGISSFLQGWLGHRYPIADGPAGSWVSVFVILAGVAVQNGQSTKETLQLLEGGMIFSGLLLFILGATGLVNRLQFLFTPLVTGSFLLILALQLSGVFLDGMLRLQGDSNLNQEIAVISIGVFVLVIVLSIKGKGWIKSYSVLFGILFGWLLYFISGQSSNIISTPDSLIKFPDILPWGAPSLNIGMAVTSIIFTFVLISNTVAAVTAVTQVIPPKSEKAINQTISRASKAGGISHVFAALFSAVGVVPLPVSAGFIRLTGQKRIFPFMAASLALAGISFVPTIVNFLATLPSPIACAASLASFVQMIGISFQSLLKDSLDERRLTILGITLLIGNGLMFLPEGLFRSLPTILQYIFSNGLIVGTILVILLEQLWKPKEMKKETTKLPINKVG